AGGGGRQPHAGDRRHVGHDLGRERGNGGGHGGMPGTSPGIMYLRQRQGADHFGASAGGCCCCRSCCSSCCCCCCNRCNTSGGIPAGGAPAGRSRRSILACS